MALVAGPGDGFGVGGADAFGGEGPVEISDECVVLTRTDSGNEVTLAFVASRVRWNSAQRSINLSVADESLVIESGDLISVGGADATSPEWVVPPDPSCPDDVFVVTSVDVPDE